MYSTQASQSASRVTRNSRRKYSDRLLRIYRLR
jgi:hypothetical protein